MNSPSDFPGVKGSEIREIHERTVPLMYSVCKVVLSQSVLGVDHGLGGEKTNAANLRLKCG